MQLPWLIVWKFPVFDPRIQCELFLAGENSNLNPNLYISFRGKIMNIKEERIVFNLGHWNTVMKMERILSFWSEHRSQQNSGSFPESGKSYCLRVELQMRKEHCWEGLISSYLLAGPCIRLPGAGCCWKAHSACGQPLTSPARPTCKLLLPLKAHELLKVRKVRTVVVLRPHYIPYFIFISF